MSYDYSSDAATASEMLAEYGQSMTLTRITPGVYDPATGTVVETGVTYTGNGVAINYAQNMINGTTILQSDQRVYLDPLIGATPQASDTMTIAGNVFNVVTSRPLSPGGIVVLHDVQIRKS